MRRLTRALALVKGIREPHEVKKNSFDLGGNRTQGLLCSLRVAVFPRGEGTATRRLAI